MKKSLNNSQYVERFSYFNPNKNYNGYYTLGLLNNLILYILNLFHKNYLLLILILGFTNTLNTQNYRESFYEYLYSSKENATTYCDTLIAGDQIQARVFGLSAKGFLLSGKKEYDLAQELFTQSLKLLDSIENKNDRLHEKVYVLNFYGLYLQDIHSISEAINVLKEGLQISNNLNLPKLQLKFSQNLGRAYNTSNLPIKAYDIAYNTLKTIDAYKNEFTEREFKSNYLNTYIGIANRATTAYMLDSIKNFSFLDSTKLYVKKAEQILKNNFGNSYQGMIVLALKADYFFYKKDFKSALRHYKQSHQIAISENFKKKAYQFKYKIGQSYFYLKQYDAALKMFKSLSEDDLETYKFLDNNMLVNFYLYEIYISKNKPELAIKYANAYVEESKEYFKNLYDAKGDNITDASILEKQQKLELALKANEDNLKAKQQLIIGIICISLLAIVSFLFFRKRNKRLIKKIEVLSNQITSNAGNKLVSNTLAKPISDPKAQEILSKIKALEKENLFLKDDFSLSLVSKKTGSNTTYVSNVVNMYWGKSFRQYTNDLRIKYLLVKLNEDPKYKKYTLQAIAESIGYKSVNTFKRHFKNITGVSPIAYINYLKKNREQA